MGSRLSGDADLAFQNLFGGRLIDLDRQAWNERARATVAGENHRTGDEKFHGESPALGREANAKPRNDNAHRNESGGRSY